MVQLMRCPGSGGHYLSLCREDVFLWTGVSAPKMGLSLSMLISYHAQFVLLGLSGKGSEGFGAL